MGFLPVYTVKLMRVVAIENINLVPDNLSKFPPLIKK